MNPLLLEMMVHDRTKEIERAARNRVRAVPQPRPSGVPVSLRLDRVHDRGALAVLAQLEGRRLPEGPFVVGEVAGSIVAALPLYGGAPLADPFHPTAEILPLLELRASQLVATEGGHGRPFRALRWIASRG
jgi:hypothetical protein